MRFSMQRRNPRSMLWKRSDKMYDKVKLKNLKVLGDGAPEAMAAFWAFDKAALADGVVPKKYKELIALASFDHTMPLLSGNSPRCGGSSGRDAGRDCGRQHSWLRPCVPVRR